VVHENEVAVHALSDVLIELDLELGRGLVGHEVTLLHEFCSLGGHQTGQFENPR